MADRERKIAMEPIVVISLPSTNDASGVQVIRAMTSNNIVWRSLSAWVRMEDWIHPLKHVVHDQNYHAVSTMSGGRGWTGF